MLTPLFSFPDNSPYKNLTIKREDCSETGSHKFRYTKRKMSQLSQQGVKRVVLSTTGNLGISASFYGRKLEMETLCLMSEKADMARAAQIEKWGGAVILSTRPKRFAEYIAKKYSIPLLRGSQDDGAIESYQSLGFEIRATMPEAKAIVNFASSGVSTIGLFQAYEKSSTLPALHVVHQEGKKIARQEDVESLVQKTGGKLWTISDGELKDAEEELKKIGLQTSWEGVSSFAVGKKIKDQVDSIVVVFSGRAWSSGKPMDLTHLNSLKEVDAFLNPNP